MAFCAVLLTLLLVGGPCLFPAGNTLLAALRNSLGAGATAGLVGGL